MVVVYYLIKNDGIPVDVPPASLSLIPDDERKMILRKTNTESRTDTLIGRILLRRILFEKFGIQPENTIIDVNENGKPYLRDHCDIYFSISHTKNCVSCAVGECPIGLDVEMICDKDHSKVASRMFTENEQLVSGKSAADFFRIWTMKESFVKMNGEGILGTSRDFDVITGHGTMDAVFVPVHIPGVAAHLCLAQAAEAVSLEISELQ